MCLLVAGRVCMKTKAAVPFVKTNLLLQMTFGWIVVIHLLNAQLQFHVDHTCLLF